MAIFGYARCSTSDALQDIDRQKRELKAMGVIEKNMFCEYESGSKADRVELGGRFEAVSHGDTVVATEVSRLTRSTKQLCEIIEIAKERQLELIIGTFKVDCRNGLDPMTDGMLKMMGVFAELEREMIRQRVRSGMANAKAKGAVIGRPATTLQNLPAPFIKHYPKYLAKEITQVELALLCGLTRQSVAKYIKIYNAGTK
jgi:DNA invertase Pin-like site-specific DNA recombinase